MTEVTDPSANTPNPASNADGPARQTGSKGHPNLSSRHLKSPRNRRIGLPISLFLITCLTTFWAGATHWVLFIPDPPGLDHQTTLWWVIQNNWRAGVIYMAAVLAILLTHEMGHFIATLLYRIPASLPFFIPMMPPIGTMGAVIMMAGHKANRKQIFDIGIAGPLAGLAVAIPILIIGIKQLDPTTPGGHTLSFDIPWIMRILIDQLNPAAARLQTLSVTQLNPYLMAAWVGLLVTGLNMLPVSQLDGGHIIYALFLRRGRWIARFFLIFSIIFVVAAEAYIWTIMIVLVTLIGADHPPTSNDDVPLGWFRTVLGTASLAIPILCFPPQGVIT